MRWRWLTSRGEPPAFSSHFVNSPSLTSCSTRTSALDTETAIFRIVQGSLANIHRHSESSVASIRISHGEDDARLEVQDHGRGIPAEKRSPDKAGVGIRGMRERVRQLGGTFEVRSSGEGTVVLARFPVESRPPRPATIDQNGASGSVPEQLDPTPVRCAEKP
jgi:signal transduction histidine kinase